MPLAPKAKERIRREFFPEDYARAVQILGRWNTKECAHGEDRSRLHAAVLNLAVGNLSNLEKYIAVAKEDFRDVLLWGEYSEGKLLRCVVCEPSEKVPNPEEEAFLESIRKSPQDNTLRLVYADWLEDRGDPRADYLRVLCEWLTSPSMQDQKLIERERELRTGGIENGWRESGACRYARRRRKPTSGNRGRGHRKGRYFAHPRIRSKRLQIRFRWTHLT